MSREIKFRAWITERLVFYKRNLMELPNEFSNKMIYDVHSIHFILETITWQEIINGEKTNMVFSNDHSQIPPTQKFILMQFTGLLDKQGKEIYELDIISDSQGKGIVYWIPEFVCFGVQEIPDRNRTFAFGKDLPIKNGRLEETEIIGNIYESKHLLEPLLGNNAEPIRNISEDDWRKDDR